MRDPSINDHLLALIQAVTEANAEKLRHTWRHLVWRGRDAAKAIMQGLETSDWSAPPERHHSAVLALMLSLLQELDARAAVQAMARIRARALHPSHSRLIAIIGQRIESEPYLAEINGVSVFIDEALPEPERIETHLRQWLAVPPKADLDSIFRLDVLARDPGYDHEAVFDFAFSGIEIVWRDQGGGWLAASGQASGMRDALFQQIGYHLHRPAGIRPMGDPHRAAEAYAVRMVQTAREQAAMPNSISGLAQMMLSQQR